MSAPTYRIGLFFGFLTLQGCGSKDHKKSQIAPVEGVRNIYVSVANPRLLEAVRIGPVSLIESSPGFDEGTTINKVAFTITNTQSQVRCFLDVELTPKGRNGIIGKSQRSYVTGQLMESDGITTNTCLESGAQGYVLTRIVTNSPEFSGITLESTSSSQNTRYTPSHQVSLVAQSLEANFVSATIKNEMETSGFKHPGYPRWIVRVGEQIADWGFLRRPSNEDSVVNPGELMELTGSAFFDRGLPADASLEVLLDAIILDKD